MLRQGERSTLLEPPSGTRGAEARGSHAGAIRCAWRPTSGDRARHLAVL